MCDHHLDDRRLQDYFFGRAPALVQASPLGQEKLPAERPLGRAQKKTCTPKLAGTVWISARPETTIACIARIRGAPGRKRWAAPNTSPFSHVEIGATLRSFRRDIYGTVFERSRKNQYGPLRERDHAPALWDASEFEEYRRKRYGRKLCLLWLRGGASGRAWAGRHSWPIKKKKKHVADAGRAARTRNASNLAAWS